MTNITDCKSSLRNSENFRERRMFSFSKNIVIKVVIKLQGIVYHKIKVALINENKI